jgi:hypothetical protein
MTWMAATTVAVLTAGVAAAPGPAAAAGEPPPAAAAPAPPAPGAHEFLDCQRFAPDERLAMRMKPEITLRHLLSYMSTVSCTPFWMQKSTQLDGWLKTVIELEPPPTATAEEAHQYLVEALDSIGFTMQPSGRFLRVVPKPAGRNDQ